MLPEYMLTYPTVFAVGEKYCIHVPFSAEVIMWVRVGDEVYYDEANGILRSGTRMHRVELPMRVLDAAGEYTVVYKKMIERTPYFPESEPERELTVRFRPVGDSGTVRLYHIADAHDLVAEPIAAGRFFGDGIDLLVLNGDIPNDGGDVENFNAICEIAAGVTGGRCPTVFARGNHDTRGICAENMQDYIPTRNGRTYYSFRVGCVWGLVLDCGEDKDDAAEPYGGTVCFHRFRLSETEFIRSVIKNAEAEYAAVGVRHKLIISHIGFAHIDKPPFDIEQELYGEWTRLLREHIKPDLMLHGHYHVVDISEKGSEFDGQGQPCTAILGSRPIFGEDGNNSFIGCAVELREDGKKRIVFNDDKGKIHRDELVE